MNYHCCATVPLNLAAVAASVPGVLSAASAAVVGAGTVSAVAAVSAAVVAVGSAPGTQQGDTSYQFQFLLNLGKLQDIGWNNIQQNMNPWPFSKDVCNYRSKLRVRLAANLKPISNNIKFAAREKL